MAKIGLNDLSSLANEETAITLINSNNTEIETKSDTFLSRNGASPNQMDANLDMNSHRILNLPAPSTVGEPLRSQELISFAAGSGTISVADGEVADGDKGNITVSSLGTVWTINNDVVSYAKMQNVTAASKLIGRGSSGSGDPQEITLGNGLTMSSTTLSSVQSGRAAADFSKTSDTTLADVTGMSVSLDAGATYSIEAEIYYTCAAAGGVKAALNGSATVTNIIYDGWLVDSAANGIKGNAQATALGNVVASSTTTGTAGHITILGTITVNAAGTLTVQFAQNTSNGTASIAKRGSSLIVNKIS